MYDAVNSKWCSIGGSTSTLDHTHSATGDGGQLDWDSVWSDAVHDHSSDAEGGTLNITGIDPSSHTHSKLVASDGAPDPAWSVDATGNLAAAGAYSLDMNAGELILDADADTSITADTDNQIDFKINSADEAHLTSSGLSAQNFAFRVKNTSGGAAAANDVGYIDENGEYKTTTTAYSNVAWCVVVSGGANNADIYVARRGRVTVALNGNCSAGDYLYTSTTAGQAQPQAYIRPELFAVALTANAGGAGGTCSALLLCHTQFISTASATDILYVASQASSDFRATINGAPVGAAVVYNAPTSGAENTIDPQSATGYGKIRLYNETRGDYALIDDVNTGTNTITLTAAAPGAWANTDVITTRSQTTVFSAPPPYFYDVDLSSADNTFIPETARALIVDAWILETGGGGYSLWTHPWEAYAGSKVKLNVTQVANVSMYRSITIPLIQRRFAYMVVASGAATASIAFRVEGWLQAVP